MFAGIKSLIILAFLFYLKISFSLFCPTRLINFKIASDIGVVAFGVLNLAKS